MRTWNKRQVFTYVMLLVLLLIRFPFAEFVSNFARLLGMSTPTSWLAGLALIDYLSNYFWFNWSFTLAGLVIVANRSEMQSLNVDIYFVAIYFAAGLAFFRFHYSDPSGWAAALMAISIFLLMNNKGFKFAAREPSLGRTLSIIAITILCVLGWSILRGTLTSETLPAVVHKMVTGLAFVVVEELIFRGMLWMFLRDVGWSSPMIVGFQAILFWLSHSYFMFSDPLNFWIIVPIGGLLIWHHRLENQIDYPEHLRTRRN